MIIIPFRNQADIIPTGANELDPLIGLQERNQRNLLDVLQAATPIIEEMAKVKPETWRSMKGLFTSLESSFGTGVKTLGQGFLAPFNQMQGRIMNMTEGFLAPVMIGINNISNQLESFALENALGTTIGSTIGFIAGFKLPGGPLLWSMIGGAVGGGIEAGFPLLTNPFDFIGNFNAIVAWLEGESDPFATQTTAAGGDIIPQQLYGSISRPGGQFGDRIGRMEQFG